MGAVFSENLHALAIVAIQVHVISFFAECVMRGCGARAVTSIRPVDYIGRPATSDMLVCASHAEALKARSITMRTRTLSRIAADQRADDG